MNEELNILNLEARPLNLTKLNKLKHLSYLIIKRTFDIICSLFGLLILIPLALVIKIIYILNKDFNKIFYSQTRIGKNGKEFKMYKFRTMIPNADKVLEELLEKDEKAKEEWNKNQKLDNDPRITKIGKLLRKTSLDEVPQFLSIFKNEMSLVGPRPLIPNELDNHNGNHKIYEAVKPGITGWWACNGRSALDYKDRLELEYYYVQNRNLKLDIKCIYLTIAAVLNKKGAK
ncbi:MAG: sugar transferase [Bacilli bacterium]|nr:sugar transferase [Bacilli bacterium]